MNKWRESAPQLETSCLFLSTSSINLESYIRPTFSLPQCWSLLGPWWDLLLNARMHQCLPCNKIPCSRCLFSENMYITLSWLLISLICLVFSFPELVFLRKKRILKETVVIAEFRTVMISTQTLFAAINLSDFCACILVWWGKKKKLEFWNSGKSQTCLVCRGIHRGRFVVLFGVVEGFFYTSGGGGVFICCLARTTNVVVNAQLPLKRNT